MSTQEAVSAGPPPTDVKVCHCSRCGHSIEAQGEHLEIISRTLLLEVATGEMSSLINQKIFPANRYCIGCSEIVFAGLRRQNLFPEMIVLLVPDLEIGQHLVAMSKFMVVRKIGGCGFTVLSMRWIGPDLVYLLQVDRHAGDVRKLTYRPSTGSVEAVAAMPLPEVPAPRTLLWPKLENPADRDALVNYMIGDVTGFKPPEGLPELIASGKKARAKAKEEEPAVVVVPTQPEPEMAATTNMRPDSVGGIPITYVGGGGGGSNTPGGPTIVVGNTGVTIGGGGGGSGNQ